MGSRSPIRPVEQTAISPAESASAGREALRGLACVSAKPSGPVQAFAPPELSSTARTRPPRSTCCVHSTGAAFTRLAVNTAAAAREGPSLMTTATSRAPDGFSPAATPAARNPSGAVTLMYFPPSGAVSRRDPLRGQARRLRQAEHEVGRLDRLARRALAEVVEGGDDHRPPGMGVGGGLQVRSVGADGRRGGRPVALGEQRGRTARRRRRPPGPPAAPRWPCPASRSRAVQVARMPRGIGASIGVNDTAGRHPPAAGAAPARSLACAGACPPAW